MKARVRAHSVLSERTLNSAYGGSADEQFQGVKLRINYFGR